MGLIDKITDIGKKLLGTTNEAVLKSYRPFIQDIGRREADMQAASDADLRQRAVDLRQRIKDGSTTIDAVKAEAFALVREVADRQLGIWKAVSGEAAGWDAEWWGDDLQVVSEAKAKLSEHTEAWELDLPASVYAKVRERFPESVPPFRMRAHDVQLIGGAVLNDGNIAEQKTGEGKTLAAVFAAYLNALAGNGVHIVTVNDYLAKRDASENAPVFKFLGMSVGVVYPDMYQEDRKLAYARDITYGTTHEFGFDYLRDNLKQTLEEQVQTRHDFAIVDEVDSVLIDEARVPLIISGPAQGRMEFYAIADQVARQLQPETHFDIELKDKAINLNEAGIERATELFGVKSMYDAEGMHLPHFLDNALKAHNLYSKDKEYMVVKGEIAIVDEFTGRVLSGRRWSEGLHQAIETKEGVEVQPETQTYATITLQNFFRLYKKLAGMTGTALTEANEFNTIYDLQPIAIPTNKPVIREDLSDLIYGTEGEKHEAIAKEVEELHSYGQPVLVGTVTVETSERMSELFKRRGIKHNVLNARQHQKEAEVILNAGQLGAVTIATNMAGRGTDIKLGKAKFLTLLKHWKQHGLAPKKIKAEDANLDEAVIDLWSKRFLGDEEAEKLRGSDPATILEAINKSRRMNGFHAMTLPSTFREGADIRDIGGLRIVGTERHDSRRIDNQLRGRAGRQGDPGSSRFYLSLEDSLMKRFASAGMANLMRSMGLKDGIPIESRMVSKSVEKAQKRVEEYNFGIRKNLLEYDQVMNLQRMNVYKQRQALLEGSNAEEAYLDTMDNALDDLVQESAGDGTRGDQLAKKICERFSGDLGLPEPNPDDIPVKEGGDACRDFLKTRVLEGLEIRRREFEEDILQQLLRFVLLDTIDRRWKDHIDHMDHLRRGISLESYGQKDPKMRFKEEGFKSFEAMSKLVRTDVARIFFRLQVQTEPPEGTRPPTNVFEQGGFQPRAAEAEPQASDHMPEPEHKPLLTAGDSNEPAPDDPCPCGSGLPYKHCHGVV